MMPGLVGALTPILLLSFTSTVQGHWLVARQDDEPNLFFRDIPQLTLCEPSIVEWEFFGRQSAMTLVVSIIGVQPLSGSTASPGPVNKTLSTSIAPFSGAFEWGVNVPPGTYRFNAPLPATNYVAQCVRSGSRPRQFLPVVIIDRQPRAI
ncbi:hypothetical protein BKA70DRAFT_502019 [Coprinopsis sp. MPI-PUGE-AT-0042]|nr:hypothetical protein BKA70DRAFT_502019 [Coprinopsis sp. MPI-PUGE-AT-0042]